MIIEICCTSKPSLYNAINGGASRLELCENLLEDGLTPSPKFLEYVLNYSSIPVHVLIRPRRGNFVYTVEEKQTILTQIEMVKLSGAQGIVIGALNDDHSLPLDLLKKWVEMAQPLDLTFHRAFDSVVQPRKSLKKIMDLGFDRILTSGQQLMATKGLALLVELLNIAKDELVIMPGGRINDQNCEVFFKEGFKEIHLSGRGLDKTTNGEPISDLKIIQKVVASGSKFG